MTDGADAIRAATSEVLVLVREGFEVPIAVAIACDEHGVSDHEAVLERLKRRVEIERQVFGS